MSTAEHHFEGGPAALEAKLAQYDYRLVGTLGRLARGELGMAISDTEAAQVVGTAVDYLVGVDPQEPVTCMDGRGAPTLLSGEPSVPRQKLAGGDTISGFAGEVLSGTHSSDEVTLDIRENPAPASNLVDSQFRPWFEGRVGTTGLHVTGTHEHGPGCGCGMCDNLPEVMHVIADEAYRHGIHEGSQSEGDDMTDRLSPVVATLQRGPFRGDVYRAAADNAYDFWVTADGGWSGKAVVDAAREVALEAGVTGEFAQATEVTEGVHREAMGVINYLSGMTLDRERFRRETGIELFWIDEEAAWKEAQHSAVNPADTHEVHARYQNIMTAQVAGAAALVGPGVQFATIGEKPQLLLSGIPGNAA